MQCAVIRVSPLCERLVFTVLKELASTSLCCAGRRVAENFWVTNLFVHLLSPWVIGADREWAKYAQTVPSQSFSSWFTFDFHVLHLVLLTQCQPLTKPYFT